MCAITGFLGFEDKTLLKKMASTLKHRGPDAEAFYVDKNISLAHRRLAIIDLDTRSNQPMPNEDETIQVVFNGEIYNFHDLRPKLKSKHKFMTESDTEVIVHGYEEWGEACVNKFNGMFAFAIWDSNKKKLFLARDRLGVKPLYYYVDNEKFIFASEIKAILQAKFIKREVNTEAFYHYMTYLNTPAPSTLFKNIYKLEPGHTLTVTKNNEKITITKQKYWDIQNCKINPNITEEEAIKKTRFLLEDSMRQRMIADVPQGVFLSGGLDSSALVAMMSERSDTPVNTFSIATGTDEKYNELKYAKIVADKFSTNHHEYTIGHKEVLRALPEIVYHEDEPIADPVNVPVYYLSKYARKEKVLVLQMGEGADELFCGYPIYGLEAKTSPYSTFLRAMPPARLAAKMALGAITIVKKKSFFEHAKDHLESMKKPSEFSRRGIIGFTEREKKEIISEELKSPTLDSYNLFRNISNEVGGEGKDAFLQKVRIIELKNRLSELLLMRVDKFTMAASIEAREPFLDYKLAEYAFSIPPYSMHMKNGISKYILKKAIGPKLPSEIVNRKKVGFGVPIAKHLAGSLKTYAKKEIEAPEMKQFFSMPAARKLISKHSKTWDNSFKIWVLLNFALWHKHWIRGEKIKI